MMHDGAPLIYMLVFWEDELGTYTSDISSIKLLDLPQTPRENKTPLNLMHHSSIMFQYFRILRRGERW